MIKWRRTSIICLLVFAVAAFTLAAASLFAPSLLQPSIQQLLSDRLGLPVACQVRRVGLFGTDVADFQVGGGAGLAVDSIRIDYTPWGLLGRRITGITLGGVTIQAILGESGPVFSFLPSRPAASSGEGKQGNELPFELGRFAVSSGRLELVQGDSSRSVPFQATITPDRRNPSVLEFHVTMNPFGQVGTLSGAVDLATMAAQIKVTLPATHLGDLTPFMELPSALTIAGTVSCDGVANLVLQPFMLHDLQFRTEVLGLSLRQNGTALAQAGDEPFVLELSKAKDTPWQLNGSELQLTGPVAGQIGPLAAAISQNESGTTATGTVTLGAKTDGPKTRGQMLLPCRFEVSLDHGGEWRASLGMQTDPAQQHETAHFVLNDLQVKLPTPTLELTGHGQGGNGELRGNLDWPGIEAKKTDISLKLPKIALHGMATFGSELGPRFEGEVSFKDARVDAVAKELNLSGIQGKIPLCWPCPAPGKKGQLSVAGINWQKRKMGAATAVLQQKGMGFMFQASHASTALPLTLQVTGEALLRSEEGMTASGTIRVPRFENVKGIDIGRIAPATAGIRVAGVFEATGAWAFDNCGLRANLLGSARQASLNMADKGLLVEGINLDLDLIDLVGLRSAPQQKLSFSRAVSGELVSGAGEVIFQIDSPQSILLEKGRVEWCGGRIISEALRIDPAKSNYDITLFCDRLRLAEVLEQLGAVGSAAGEGQMNGRVPLRIAHGEIRFDDAFLFSTPGSGGTIKLQGTEKITAGIPAGTPQFSQLDLAREALKDFSYQWARIRMTTEGENLLLRLELEGEPAGPLPFVFNSEFGGFARVTGKSPGSRFQGIGLDVNFRFPLDTILYYGKSIRDTLK